MVVNEKELLLLSFFRKDARMPLTQISRLTKIPVSTIYDKLKRFEEGVIFRHTTLLDFKKLGFDLKMHLFLKVDKDGRNDVEDYLKRNVRTNSVHKVNNGFDFMAECIFKNLQDLDAFLESLECFRIQERKEYFILEDLKQEGFLTTPEASERPRITLAHG
jgi:DNA-binding Lrp family transcriptional regulator